MLLEMWQVYIAPVDKEDLLKQLQSLLTEPAREDFPLVAPALAKARSPHLTPAPLQVTVSAGVCLSRFLGAAADPQRQSSMAHAQHQAQQAMEA